MDASRRKGRGRVFSKEDKRRIIDEALQPVASLSGFARSYGIAPRLLFCWKQELSVAVLFHISPPNWTVHQVRSANGQILKGAPLPNIDMQQYFQVVRTITIQK